MNRYDENNLPKKVCLLDLAISRWANPCADLLYFIYFSTTPQLRATNLEDILEFYHTKLSSTFHKLGIDPTIYPFRYFYTHF